MTSIAYRTTGIPLRALGAFVTLLALLAAPLAASDLRADVRVRSATATIVSPEVATAVASLGEAAVIVRTVPGSLAVAQAAVERGGGEVTLALPIVDGFAADVNTDAVLRLERLGKTHIVGVTLDGPVAFAARPDTRTAKGKTKEVEGTVETTTGITFDAATDSYYVETIGADRLHAQGITGRGVGIAVIDTGVTAVPDVQGRLVGGIDLTVEADGVDRYGHGTFLAGIAAGDGAASGGRHAGVAPGAHIVPVKIAGANGAADVSQVLAALQWVVSFRDVHDIEVLNLSFGTDSTQSQRTDPMNYAVEKAWDAGIVVVAAAANHGPAAGTVMKPGDDPLVITVGATDSMGTTDRRDDIVSAFSSRGPTVADGLMKPDLVAPGAHLVGLRSPGSTIDEGFPEARVDNAYFRGSGTSFSTAVVSGAVALLRQAHPTWTPDQIKGALLSTTAPGPVGDRNIDGHGAIDLPRAHALASPPAANAGVVRSDGTGSLEASRGSLELAIVTDPVTTTVGNVLGILTDPVGTVLKVLAGETTVQDELFDGTQFRTVPWEGHRWYDSQWVGHRWYDGEWQGHRWYEAEWNGHRWYESAWYADTWS